MTRMSDNGASAAGADADLSTGRGVGTAVGRRAGPTRTITASSDWPRVLTTAHHPAALHPITLGAVTFGGVRLRPGLPALWCEPAPWFEFGRLDW